MRFLFWIMTLNSVVNPWIFMMFNTHLVDSLKRLFCQSCYESRHNGGPRGLKRGLLNSFKKQNIPTSDLKRRSISPRFVVNNFFLQSNPYLNLCKHAELETLDFHNNVIVSNFAGV